MNEPEPTVPVGDHLPLTEGQLEAVSGGGYTIVQEGGMFHVYDGEVVRSYWNYQDAWDFAFGHGDRG